jgi:regulator of protease activity HflC (stomatin/prohibitin superfamily)
VGGLGQFLLEAAAWLYDFWPFRIVKEWEQGVRLLGGHTTKLLKHDNARRPFRGVHAFWPGIGEILVQETNIETPETDLQDFVSKDGTAWAAAVAITFRIHDLRAHYLRVHDAEQTIIAEVKAAVATAGSQLNDLEMATQLGERALEGAKAQTRGWGLDIKRVEPTTLTRAQQIRLVSDAPS